MTTAQKEVKKLAQLGGVRIVRLKRSNKSRVPSDVYKDSVTKIGSEWKADSRDIIRGLSHEEAVVILPSIIGVEPSSANWDETVKAYWADFTVRVPEEGLELNIWEDDEGFPAVRNAKDWITYKFCQKSSKVATSESERQNMPMYQYYIEDDKEILAAKAENLAVRKDAQKLFLQLFRKDKAGKIDGLKVNWVLEMYKKHDSNLGNYGVMSSDEKEIYLDGKLTEDPMLFKGIVEDDKLKDKAFISECVSKGLINHVGNAYYNGDEKMGDYMEETILYLNDPKNSNVLVTLKERLKAQEAVTIE